MEIGKLNQKIDYSFGNSTSMNNAAKEVQKIILDQVLCIYYFVKKDNKVIRDLINSGSEFNMMTLT